MDDCELLAELGPAAVDLLDRHLATAREWFPHELIAWTRPAKGRNGELPPGVRSALLVNLLTEDNLPFYFAGILRQLGSEDPWWTWLRRWTAEEMRHATVLRDYVVVTGALDLRQLERTRMAHVCASQIPTAAGAAEAFVYLTLQERATRIAHW